MRAATYRSGPARGSIPPSMVSGDMGPFVNGISVWLYPPRYGQYRKKPVRKAPTPTATQLKTQVEVAAVVAQDVQDSLYERSGKDLRKDYPKVVSELENIREQARVRLRFVENTQKEWQAKSYEVTGVETQKQITKIYQYLHALVKQRDELMRNIYKIRSEKNRQPVRKVFVARDEVDETLAAADAKTKALERENRALVKEVSDLKAKQAELEVQRHNLECERDPWKKFVRDMRAAIDDLSQ